MDSKSYSTWIEQFSLGEVLQIIFIISVLHLSSINIFDV